MKLSRKLFQALASILALTGCTKADIMNLTVPSTGYSVYKDIAYGDNKRQHLDVYVPDAPDPHHSVIVFFYGGSWQMGYKELYRFAGQAFASKGYVTVIADYRLYPEVYFPAFVDDSARAVAWTHEHIHEYGGDNAYLYLAGHSAGGYLAVMLTLNESYLKAAGGSRSWIRGTMGIAGPYDFLPFTDPAIKALFSKADDAQTQPITFAAAHMPPMLLMNAQDDRDVGLKNTTNLAKKLREFGNPVEERLYPGVAHIGIVLALSDFFRSKAPVLDDMDHFIQQHNNASAGQ